MAATSGRYAPQAGVHIGRPPCANCGAAYRLHQANGACPVQAPMSSTLEEAVHMLAAAHDPARRFALRGEVQRRMGHRPFRPDHCPACSVLLTAPTLA